MAQEHLPFPLAITATNDSFPDYEGIDPTNGHRITVEIEVFSSHFRDHGHDPGDCDYIVCWEDDWKPAPPLRIVSLKKLFQTVPGRRPGRKEPPNSALRGHILINSSSTAAPSSCKHGAEDSARRNPNTLMAATDRKGGDRLNAFVAITDTDWFDFLSSLSPQDEVNFWQPSPRGGFRSLEIGEPFLFKLHSPNDFIVGGGFFLRWTSLPASLAWEAFGEKNGAYSFPEMRSRIDRYRRPQPAPHEDPDIGCIVLLQPFFLKRVDWIPVPEWRREIVRGKTVDVGVEPWQSVWDRVQSYLATSGILAIEERRLTAEHLRYGEAYLVTPRLGQGAFRVLVTDAYHRRCAVTGEKVLPVLHAAHIRPFADGGEHRIDNGLLLRSDLHILFDKGYFTVTPEYRVEVSRRLRADFKNGEEYFRWHGRTITLPQEEAERPSPEFISWHNEHAFVG